MRARTICLDVVLVVVLSATAGACASPNRAQVLGEQITRSTSAVSGVPAVDPDGASSVTTGTITGSTGRGGVTLTLYSGSTPGPSVNSADDGTFVFRSVKAGAYDVVASVGGNGTTCDTAGVCLAGPATYTKTRVVVTAGQTVTVNPKVI